MTAEKSWWDFFSSGAEDGAKEGATTAALNSQNTNTQTTNPSTGTNWGQWVGPALTAGTTLIGGIMASRQADKEAKAAAEATEADKIQALQLEALRAKYGIGMGGGGGGGGGGGSPFTKAQRLAAMSTNQALDANAINSLISAYQSGLFGGG